MKYIIEIPSELYEVNETLRVPASIAKGTRIWIDTHLKMIPYHEPESKKVEEKLSEIEKMLNEIKEINHEIHN